MSIEYLAIVTGASRGFGRSVCKELAKQYGEKLRLVLVARSDSGLNETKTIVKEFKTIDVVTLVGDLGNTIGLETVHNQIFEACKDVKPKQRFLINNAGSLGDLSKHVKDYSNIKELQAYCDFNLVSCISLTAKFLKEFDGDENVVVNVSSLLAVKAFAGWGMYAMAKAGRDMFHAVVAEESWTTKSLNFAPGPLDTDMQKDVRDTICDEGQKKAYTDMHTESKLVSPDDSASKLVQLLVKNNFESGTHVDYYDV